jgi:hypothetical protein
MVYECMVYGVWCMVYSVWCRSMVYAVPEVSMAYLWCMDAYSR